MDIKSIRTQLMLLYGTASAFNLIDTRKVLSQQELAEELIAAKATGIQLRNGLLQLINQIPKEK